MKIKGSAREELYFYLFISPWIIGFLVFTAFPVISSLVLSFHDYDGITPMRFIGFDNYKNLFQDELFYHSIKTTFLYTVISVPLLTSLSLAFAMLLNRVKIFKNTFRTVLYFPSMVSGATMSLLWLGIFNPHTGLIDYILGFFGIEGPQWLLDERYALSSVIIMALWSVGGGMVIFLASLKSVPITYYEAAYIDGARGFTRFFRITLPMISPVVLFQVIMQVIDSFQIFTPAYVMTQGGPHYSTWFYVYYLYKSAFSDSRIGYSSALGWLLLIFVTIISFYIIKSSRKHVYYEGGEN